MYNSPHHLSSLFLRAVFLPPFVGTKLGRPPPGQGNSSVEANVFGRLFGTKKTCTQTCLPVFMTKENGGPGWKLEHLEHLELEP